MEIKSNRGSGAKHNYYEEKKNTEQEKKVHRSKRRKCSTGKT